MMSILHTLGEKECYSICYSQKKKKKKKGSKIKHKKYIVPLQVRKRKDEGAL